MGTGDQKENWLARNLQTPLPWSSVMALFSPLIFVVYPLRVDLLTAVNVFSFQADWGQRMPW